PYCALGAARKAAATLRLTLGLRRCSLGSLAVHSRKPVLAASRPQWQRSAVSGRPFHHNQPAGFDPELSFDALYRDRALCPTAVTASNLPGFIALVGANDAEHSAVV